MKIAKIVPFRYEIVYIDSGGKYSAYKRSDSGEWSDAITGKKQGYKESEELESAYKKSMDKDGKL